MLQKIVAPTTCPSCNSVLEQVKDQLFCRHSSCGTKLQKSVEHFAKTLKIKGLGPASIQKLQLNSISDIYELNEEYVASILGDKISNKLIAEINNSKLVSLNQLLPAFGIPLIGTSAAKKLCKVISHITDISKEKCDKAGIGPKASENLLFWYKTDLPLLSSLEFSYKTEKEFEGTKGIVCITGKLTSYKNKDEAHKALIANGYEVRTSVTKDVTILVNESGIASTKTIKAEKAGILIENNLNNLIRN